MTCTINRADVASSALELGGEGVPGSVAGVARGLLAEQAEQAGRGWSRSDAELLTDVADLVALRAQVDGLLLEAVGEVETRGLAASRGCTSTGAWLRSAHRIAPNEASRLVRTATAVRTQLPAVAQAMGAGAVSLAQAEVICTAIGELPAETPVACRPRAEATMVDYAGSFDPVLLARIGRRLAEIVDPDGVQARDEKPLLDREHDSYRDRTLTLCPDTNGAGGILRARLDAVGYATFAAYLDSATAAGLAPTLGRDNTAASAGTDQDPASQSVGDTRTIGQRRHDAAIEAARQMLTGGRLPSSGGVKPRIVITAPATSLTDCTGAARLPDGNQLSQSLTWQIACDADLIPVTVDRAGNPLDVGRTRRLFTGRLRTALEVRDRGCAWPGCDRPTSWTQAHHIRSWLDGGATSVDNGVLLCLFHHHQIEQGDWTVTIDHGRAWFTPPTWIDPHRRPQINPMHHPPPL